MRTSSEVLSIFIAMLAVLFGFGGMGILVRLVEASLWPYDVGVLAGLIAGFVVHELAHRQVAVRSGCAARFVLWPLGLAITMLSGILRSIGFGFVLLMPGYVSIVCFGWGSSSSSVWISAAGPLTNIVLAAVGLAGVLTGYYSPWFWYGFGSINAWLAFFNLLPLHPLDGSKIMAERPQLWLALFASSLVLLYLLQSM